MRSHVSTVALPLSAARVFGMLVTPRHIRGWWAASSAIVLPGVDGRWVAAWGDEDDPDYVSAAQISVWEPGLILELTNYRYYAKTGGLPFEADFVTGFRITSHPDRPNSCDLQVQQTGFPDDPVADEYYEGCEIGWEKTCEMMREYAETIR